MGEWYLWKGTTLIIKIIGKLSATNHHFKYIVNCIILAAGGNGMDVAGLCYWDQEMDGSVTVKYDNKHMTCIVNIFGCAIWWLIILQNQIISFFNGILGKEQPFLTIFYFYVILIKLYHLSPNAIFLSFLNRGSSGNELSPTDKLKLFFFNFGDNPICSKSLRLKY